MSALEQIAMMPSPEAELIRKIEDLIRTLARGEEKDGDLQLLHELQRQRVEMMRPKAFKKRIPA